MKILKRGNLFSLYNKKNLEEILDMFHEVAVQEMSYCNWNGKGDNVGHNFQQNLENLKKGLLGEDLFLKIVGGSQVSKYMASFDILFEGKRIDVKTSIMVNIEQQVKSGTFEYGLQERQLLPKIPKGEGDIIIALVFFNPRSGEYILLYNDFFSIANILARGDIFYKKDIISKTKVPIPNRIIQPKYYGMDYDYDTNLFI